MAGDGKRILMHSGGLDSHILWHWLGAADSGVTNVYVGHKAKNELQELTALVRLKGMAEGFDYDVVGAETMIAHADSHIPHRNLRLMLKLAVAYPQVEEIYYGALRGEASADKSEAFIAAASRCLSESEGRRIDVIAPFAQITKTQVVRLGYELVPLAELDATRSCYSWAEGVCGQCQACFRRDAAFASIHKTPMPTLPDQALTRGPLDNLVDTPIRRLPALLAANRDYVAGRMRDLTPWN